MSSIYNKIIDFVSLCKKLEYLVKLKYSQSNESIHRAVVLKEIPRKGDVELNGVSYEFLFHGLGITFKNETRNIHYNVYSSEGLSVFFTFQNIFEDYKFEITEDVQKEIDSLIENNFIRQWMPEIPFSEVYYLV